MELLSEFCRDFGTVACEIRAALAKGDDRTAAGQAHTLKGAAANLSVTALTKAAARLETSIASRDRQHGDEQLAVIETAIQALLEAVDRWTQNAVPPYRPKDVVDHDPDLSRRIEKLARLITADDLEAESHWHQVRPHLDSDRFSRQIKTIDDSLNRLDFEKAQEPLRIIAEGSL